MNLTTLTYQVAFKIASGSRYQLDDFYKNGTCNEVILFSHYNFFYSYPEFGKLWENGKISEFHRTEIMCHLCKETPERNYAGIGNIWLLHNGISDKQILVRKGYKTERGRKIPIIEYVLNTPRLSQFICLCENHIGSHFQYKKEAIKKVPLPLQLQLF